MVYLTAALVQRLFIAGSGLVLLALALRGLHGGLVGIALFSLGEAVVSRSSLLAPVFSEDRQGMRWSDRAARNVEAVHQACVEGDGEACLYAGILTRYKDDKTGATALFEKGCAAGYTEACVYAAQSALADSAPGSAANLTSLQNSGGMAWSRCQVMLIGRSPSCDS